MQFANRLSSYFQGNGHDVLPTPTPKTSLEEKQEMLAHMVRLVARGRSHGLFVAGVGGIGKSRTIERTLTEEGITPILVNSHITPLMLYRVLFESRKGRLIWLEDCDSIYTNMQALGLLRSALWGQGQRIVTYTSSQLDDIPSRFVFDSQIIFCANTIPKRNEAFKAVLSRVDQFTLHATNDELLEQMRTLAANGYNQLSHDQCLEVVEFIANRMGGRQLSMRLFEPSLLKFEYALETSIDWRPLVASQLNELGRVEFVPNDEASPELDMLIMKQAFDTHPTSVKQQETFWTERTHKSRASFFRCKKRYEQEEAK